MASIRGGNPYQGSTGGKFRKRLFKKSQPTLYDRPPSALRRVTASGWLSKIVDPAQRFITSAAQIIFSTVLLKRLPPPLPPLPPLQEAEQDLKNMDLKATSSDPVGVAGNIYPSDSDSASDKSDVCGVTELEQILKQKSFTRSEIDRLTCLLHLRTIETPGADVEKKSQMASPEFIVPHCREEVLTDSAIENRIRSHAVSTSLATSTVLDDDFASPAEIAKAYMETRSSKVSQLMYASQTSGYRTESTLPSRHPIPSKTPFLPLIPSSPGHTNVSENGLITPTSRGRFAIYTMARTPYSRVHAIENMASTYESGRPSSSSQTAWEQRSSWKLGPKRGVLKRRNSVFDDIESVGCIRRIRQKPNIISTKGLSSPAYYRPISMNEPGVGSDALQHFQSSNLHPLFYSIRKSLLSGAPTNNIERSKESGGNVLPSTSIPSIPSKSREMASKILEQIDKLTPPKEKSSVVKYCGSRDKVPTKLLPSLLHGQALKSLGEDSSKYLENIQDNKLSNSSLEISVPYTWNISS